MDVMDIASLSMVMSQQKVMSEWSTGMLSKSLDTVEAAADTMTKSLESLASPATMGTVIDVAV